MKPLSIALSALVLLTAGVAQAAPQTRVRDVSIHTGWRWGEPLSEDFVATLREEVDDRLAVCAAGQDLRLDVKIERLNIRQPKDLRPNALNFLDAQVKVRRASDKGVIDLLGINGYYTFLSMIMNGAQTAYPEGDVPALKKL